MKKVWVIEVVDYVSIYDENERLQMVYDTFELFESALCSFLDQGYHVETYILDVPDKN